MRKPDGKIVLLGDMNVGKTSLLQRYMERRFPDTVSTVGGAFYLKQWRSFNISIWDTAGESRRLSARWAPLRAGDAGLPAFWKRPSHVQGPTSGGRSPLLCSHSTSYDVGENTCSPLSGKARRLQENLVSLRPSGA